MKNETMTDTIRVGVQRNITDKNCPVESVPLLSVLEQMHASENLKAITTAIVKAQNKHEVDVLKRTLPAVIISADTTHRKVHPDDVRTGLILMDIDSGDNPDMDIDEMRVVVEQMRRRYDYLIGFTLSATWRGLKVLCAVSKRADEHVRCFMALEEIFSQHGINVDRACKDLKRVNYVPHDPNVQETLIKHLADWNGAYIEPADPPKKRAQYRAPAISAGSDMTPDEEAQLCLQHMNPDMDYADWIAVGMALKDHGCCCATWDAWSAGAESYKQGECERKWAGFSGSGVGFGTVVKLATDGNGGKNPLFIKRDKLNVTADDFDNIMHDNTTTDDDDDDKDNKTALPQVTDAEALMAMYPTEPVSLIEGVVGVGDKLILSASSKAGKTWLMLHLAYAMQNGDKWLGHQCKKCDVLYVNFELTEPWLGKRFRLITQSKPFQEAPSVLNLRGFNVGWTELSKHIKQHIETAGKKYGLIILDPIYKMLGECDENSNGDVAMLLNALERMGHETQTATAFSHHHSKGNKSGVDAIERMSGAGVWGREPDAIIDLTAHEDEDCWVVDTTARNYAKPPKVVVRCEFPNFVPVEDGDPDALKKPGGSSKKLTEANVLDMCRTVPLGLKKANLVNMLAENHNVSKPTVRARISEMTKNDKLCEKDKMITITEDDNPF